MSQKKIIFLVIVGLVVLITIIGISYLTSEKKPVVSQESIKIWITEGTTEAYMPLIE
jgi:CHASE3 domain sensor protein